ncbi:MAG: tRNA pseudouridine(55) synthase TruB [Muribaculaceae bacterium]|nr:tRNA pseudouridine(55) synthase TruB [Muribaculaceae bacterium]MDE6521352.1 tRNA pseudouridine(55) synthase TruB [Muribaculaceae bacterium]MDE6786533.1 tRNA pseudouridine(55) synthase TruB [Muribaculaceae bacterium]
MDFITGEIIGIDKPLGWTSFDAVKRVRGAIQRRLNVKKFKVGHAGTLDPLATGVLIICTGRSTRDIERLQNGTKEYIATIRLGATTPSFDLETEIDAEYPYEHITEEMIQEVLPNFVGNIMQVPPVYSAVKIDGKRAYKYARKGAEVELKAKPLVIDEIKMLPSILPELKLRIVCSKGTYIRALTRDIGKALNSGAHLTALCRTRVGNIRLEDCMSVDQAVEKIANCEISYPEDFKLTIDD